MIKEKGVLLKYPKSPLQILKIMQWLGGKAKIHLFQK